MFGGLFQVVSSRSLDRWPFGSRSLIVAAGLMFVRCPALLGCSHSFFALVVLMAVTGRGVEVPDRSPTLVTNL